ncbi:carbon-nitrogen hydrolase [Parathielavia appendiculata]|uniref:Carbon-nitrogen hydrolase n=1 Tax=Parathielavia appendiculata TaxID=2587402 RepID=A0AAN6Z7J7_9PEZI|nr:carbon-nitrogen hydrolase [Parathielavia appendiculata]
MRIGCLQFAPKVGDVSNNITRAEEVLARADPEDLDNLDLLVLPEMAFSGYNFKSQQHILPYLEPTGSGASSRWASTVARKYRCNVAVGYPEKADIAEQPSAPDYYNSLIVVNSVGENIAHYRKSFLYYTDATWAREGQGFYGGKLGSLGQAAIGICMDINPYKFEAPWDAYEFAFHVLRIRANLVILSTAWLTNDEQASFLSCPDAPDMSTLSYWVRRLEPVIRAKDSEETIVVFANRSGAEDEATYAGSSTVLGIKDGEVSVYGILGRGVEKLLVIDTERPPFGKIIDRPEVPVDGEPGAPSAPAEDHGDGPFNGPAPAAASGYADSPTLPAGAAHPTRNHPTLPPSVSTSTIPRPQSTGRRTLSQPRPKLTVQTNLSSPTPPRSSPTKRPVNHHLRPSPPQPTPPEGHPTWNGGPPSAIHILVDVYTPDEQYGLTWHNGNNDDGCERGGLGVSVRFGISDTLALSPWSGGWNNSGVLSPAGCGKAMIPIAASPSIFGRGGLRSGGVCI